MLHGLKHQQRKFPSGQIFIVKKNLLKQPSYWKQLLLETNKLFKHGYNQ